MELSSILVCWVEAVLLCYRCFTGCTLKGKDKGSFLFYHVASILSSTFKYTHWLLNFGYYVLFYYFFCCCYLSGPKRSLCPFQTCCYFLKISTFSFICLKVGSIIVLLSYSDNKNVVEAFVKLFLLFLLVLTNSILFLYMLVYFDSVLFIVLEKLFAGLFWGLGSMFSGSSKKRFTFASASYL